MESSATRREFSKSNSSRNSALQLALAAMCVRFAVIDRVRRVRVRVLCTKSRVGARRRTEKNSDRNDWINRKELSYEQRQAHRQFVKLLEISKYVQSACATSKVFSVREQARPTLFRWRAKESPRSESNVKRRESRREEEREREREIELIGRGVEGRGTAACMAVRLMHARLNVHSRSIKGRSKSTTN